MEEPAERIGKALQSALQNLGIEGIEAALEHPADLTHGDFSTNVALAAAKREGVLPRELAEKIVAELSDVPGISRIEIAGPGFINFHLSRDAFAESIAAILKNGKWGNGDVYSGRTVMIEYTSPNLFKPLHIGNLVGNIIGESLSRLYEASGAAVKRVNYPSDIGLTVAKGVWGLKTSGLNPDDIADLGKAYVLGNSAYEENEKAKKEITEINKALYAGSDPALSELRERGIATSKRHLDAICAQLGTTFNAVFFESQSGVDGAKIVAEHVGDVFEKSDGAVVYKGEADGLHTRVFLNSQGLPTYEAKEVGLFQLKNAAYPDFDTSVTVTGGEQSAFFQVVFAAIRKVFPKETQGKTLLHVANGFLALTTGKMSSRKGNVITGESLIEEMRTTTLEKMKDRDLSDAEKKSVADAVAVAAIKYSILKQATGKNIVFDPAASLSFEGDSGPYLQYSHVRALSVLRKAKEEGVPAEAKLPPEEVPELERLLYRFPEVVVRAEEEKEPHYVTTFLTELAGAFNSWYAKEKIVDSTDTASAYKVALTQAFAVTMKRGLWLLGIQAPEKM